MTSHGYIFSPAVTQISSNSFVSEGGNSNLGYATESETLHDVEVGIGNIEESGSSEEETVFGHDCDPSHAPVISYQLVSSYSPLQIRQLPRDQEEPDHPYDI